MMNFGELYRQDLPIFSKPMDKNPGGSVEVTQILVEEVQSVPTIANVAVGEAQVTECFVLIRWSNKVI